MYMVREHRKLFKGYAVFVVSVGFLFSILLLLVPALDLNFLGDSRSSRRLIMQLGELQHMAYGPYYIVMALLPALVGCDAEERGCNGYIGLYRMDSGIAVA